MRIRSECVPEFANHLDNLEISWEHIWSNKASYQDIIKVSPHRRLELCIDIFHNNNYII